MTELEDAYKLLAGADLLSYNALDEIHDAYVAEATEAIEKASSEEAAA